MNRKDTYKAAGSRGGSSYWTNRRIIRRRRCSFEATDRTGKVTEQQNDAGNNVCSSSEISPDLAVSTDVVDEVDSTDEDDINDPILSDEEDVELTISEENDSDGNFEPVGREVFRDLVCRHPGLSNTFIDDMLSCLRTVGISVP